MHRTGSGSLSDRVIQVSGDPACDDRDLTSWRQIVPPCARSDKVRILPTRLAVAQRFTSQGADGPAGCLQHRLRRAGVPLHGPAEARVEIGGAFGQTAELDRGAEV